MNLDFLLVTTGILVIISITNARVGRVRFESRISMSNRPSSNDGYLYPKSMQKQNPAKSAMRGPKVTHSFNHRATPNGHEMEFSMQHDLYRPKPRSKPKPKPEPKKEPEPASPADPEPEPYEGIEAWDKKTLIENVIAAYKDTCKSSDIVIFSPESKLKLVSSVKKMPLEVNDYPWVMNVEMFCTLNFWRVHSCFSMPLEDGFKKALIKNGIDFTDGGAHGPSCSLIRKFEADELKESRTVAEDDLKKALTDILLEEFHKSRSWPNPTKLFEIPFPMRGAKDAYWTLSTKIRKFNTYLNEQPNDFCTAFHTDAQLFDHFEKFTAGTEKTKVDDAFRNLTSVMKAIPLEKDKEKEGSEDNCTYDLFLFRVELEFFLALDTAIIDWLSKYVKPDNHNYEYFCREKEYCLYAQLRKKIRESKEITEKLIKNLGDWFEGRKHGLINDDFKYFAANYVAERFRIKMPAPPEPLKLKVKYEHGGYKNKVLYEHDGRNMRMLTKVSHPKSKIQGKTFPNSKNFSFHHQYNNGIHGDISEEDGENDMYMPKSAYANPNNFSFHHQFNGTHGDISEEGDEGAGHEMHEGASSEENMHAQMEMNHEYDNQHPYDDTSFELGHEEITDKNGKKQNVLNYRCRMGPHQMNYQFGYDPACAV
uniref:Uncharacterized protein n=1 Tax=Meloidogyne enterolobii TaxID=390850 RepID=A0A6V7W731_MELEN|nr:unnamed protein product [Meloidogyne enterolobii]